MWVFTIYCGVIVNNIWVIFKEFDTLADRLIIECVNYLQINELTACRWIAAKEIWKLLNIIRKMSFNYIQNRLFSTASCRPKKIDLNNKWWRLDDQILSDIIHPWASAGNDYFPTLICNVELFGSVPIWRRRNIRIQIHKACIDKKLYIDQKLCGEL